MTPHSSTLAWKIPWTEEPGRLQSMGSLRVGHDWTTSLSLSLSCIGEGNGNPLQCSCLENPRTGEPGGLPSMGSHRVRHDWSDLAALCKLTHLIIHQQLYDVGTIISPFTDNESLTPRGQWPIQIWLLMVTYLGLMCSVTHFYSCLILRLTVYQG